MPRRKRRFRNLFANLNRQRAATFVGNTIIALALLGLAVAALLGQQPLTNRAAAIVATDRPAIEIQWPESRVPGAPRGSTWLPKSIQADLTALAADALDQNPAPLSRWPLADVAAALRQSGWFSSGPTVSRADGGRIVVSGRWREPAAAVYSGDLFRLVSTDSRLLPVTYRPDQPMPIQITGIAAPHPGAGADPIYGETWSGDDLAAALELIDLVRRQEWSLQVRAVDASDFAASKRLAIITNSGGRIVWGGRASRPLLGECSTKAKLANISRLLASSGTIDGGFGVVEVYWDGQPLRRTPRTADAQGVAPTGTP